MQLHIGKRVKEVVRLRKLTVAEFARRIHTSRENVYGIFERASMDSSLLLKISLELNHNFFNDILSENNEQDCFSDEKSIYKKQNKHQYFENYTKELKIQIEDLTNENRILKEVQYYLLEQLRSFNVQPKSDKI